MEQKSQPYLFKRPSGILALWSLILVLVVGLWLLHFLRSAALGTIFDFPT